MSRVTDPPAEISRGDDSGCIVGEWVEAELLLIQHAAVQGDVHPKCRVST